MKENTQIQNLRKKLKPVRISIAFISMGISVLLILLVKGEVIDQSIGYSYIALIIGGTFFFDILMSLITGEAYFRGPEIRSESMPVLFILRVLLSGAILMYCLYWLIMNGQFL